MTTVNHKPPPIVVDVVMALAAGAIAVATIPPFSVIALVFCVAVAITAARARLRCGRRRAAAWGVIASTVVIAGVVAAAAAYRPAKVVEQQLNRSMTLPANRMTLAELAYYVTFDRHRFPVHTSISFAAADRDMVIEWPQLQLTMRQFLEAIESQTHLRYKFGHCGNGYTVLGGGDCSFGLVIFDPDFSREPFDVDDYAMSRDAAAGGFPAQVEK